MQPMPVWCLSFHVVWFVVFWFFFLNCMWPSWSQLLVQIKQKRSKSCHISVSDRTKTKFPCLTRKPESLWLCSKWDRRCRKCSCSRRAGREAGMVQQPAFRHSRRRAAGKNTPKKTQTNKSKPPQNSTFSQLG